MLKPIWNIKKKILVPEQFQTLEIGRSSSILYAKFTGVKIFEFWHSNETDIY